MMKSTRKMYCHGYIYPMKDEQSVEALVIEDSKIVYAGDVNSAKEFLGDGEVMDLAGKTMLPGFIDAHSHISKYATILDLVSLQEIGSIEELQERFVNFMKKHPPKDQDWIIGFGYDHNFLVEKRHPTRYDLDKISRDHPILVSHTSGHMAVVNSKGLQLMGLDEHVLDPQGGKFGRDASGLDGYMEETAFMKYCAGLQKQPDLDDLLAKIEKAQSMYASYGITTAQEGMMKAEEFALLDQLAKEDRLLLDIVGYVDLKDHHNLVKEHSNYVKQYEHHFKIGGYKIFLDGSPQGKTAWLSEPYEGEDTYCGYPVYRDEEVHAFIEQAMKEHMQLLAHCNGDAAAEQLLQGFEEYAHVSTRPVMIHAQLARCDQIKRMKKIGMIPSFFMAHVWYWGDIHIHNLGIDRASKISNAKTAIAKNMPFTMHQDTPVIEPNMIETIWIAANRLSKQGVLLGGDYRIRVFEAICGLTKYAAYQYFEEDTKGTLEPGKLADMVILERNPFTCGCDELRYNSVLETIKEGNTIYKKS